MELPSVTLTERLRAAAASRGEELLAELSVTVRRVALLLLVVAISVPVFLAGCLAVLAWYVLG
jgi:hypothetical protein